MARAGGFSGSLRPFGGGTLSGLSQYDIGADLADLEVYGVEVAWGNGLATDEEFLAALRKAVAATDPDTQRRESSQNKLDDAVYRIDRSKAEAVGLDALIAFDQGALAKMKPDNVRFRDVQDSLRSELAQRRSRDYGKLVDAYNDGTGTTQSLIAWVKANTGGLTSDDPDFESWRDVTADLDERVRDEADAKVYQDYQQDRMTGTAFLAHLTKRRDAYSPDSPKWADWNRKLEDATDNVRDKAQAKKDQAFFNRYELGKVSDASYLKYLRTRISGMEPGDPEKAAWQHRLTQASFSLAEDKLRFDVQRGRASPAKLATFYRNYQRTLNPGSAEYRQIARALMSLGSGGGGGGGGGGRRSSGGGGGGGGSKPATTAIGKMISSKYTLANIMPLFSIDPTASKSAISGAKKYLDLNVQTLGNAVRAGDSVWLFQDPRKPGATVAGRYPDGSPMLDAQGKPIMVRGSAYLPASNEAYANLKAQEGRNWSAAAEYALARGKTNDYAYFLRRSAEALDQARASDAQGREQDWEDWYKQTSQAVDHLTQQGDYGAAALLAADLLARLSNETANPYLDDTRRTRLDELGTKLEGNPLLPKTFTDPFSGKQSIQEGAVNMTDLANGRVTLNPGWHHVLKGDAAGRPDYGPVLDQKQDGSWEQNHVTVHTKVGDRVVTGEVAKSTASTAPKMFVNTGTARRAIDLGLDGVDFISFPDENGRLVRAYSLDGQNWIVPGPGLAPTVEINRPLRERPTVGGGKEIFDPETNKVVFREGAGGWEQGEGFDGAGVDWFGAAEWNAARSQIRPNYDRTDREQSRLVTFERQRVEGMSVGGEGQHMQYATMSASGVVNLTPSQWEYELRQERGLDMEERRAVQLARGRPSRAQKDDVYRPPQVPGRAEKDDLYRQLPADTPPRFEGRNLKPGQRPSALPVTRPKPTMVLPPPTRPVFQVTGPTSLSRAATIRPPALKQSIAARKTTPPRIKPKTTTRPKQKIAARKTTPPRPKAPLNARTAKYMSTAEKV